MVATSPTAPFDTRDAAWIPAAVRLASFNSDVKGIDRYTQIIIHVEVSAVLGTNPTLDIYLQTLMPDDTTWVDIASFAQFIAASKQVLGFVAGGNSVYASTDGALAAATVKAMPLGRKIRLKCVLAGTEPSFNLIAQLISLT